MEVRGIKDLMETHGITPKYLQQALIKSRLYGNWESQQNTYNLINGKVRPKEPMVYIWLAEFFDMSIREMLSRYSLMGSVTTKVEVEDLF